MVCGMGHIISFAVFLHATTLGGKKLKTKRGGAAARRSQRENARNEYNKNHANKRDTQTNDKRNKGQTNEHKTPNEQTSKKSQKTN